MAALRDSAQLLPPPTPPQPQPSIGLTLSRWGQVPLVLLLGKREWCCWCTHDRVGTTPPPRPAAREAGVCHPPQPHDGVGGGEGHARRRRVRTSSTGAHPRVSVGCRYEHRGSVKANCAWRIATECSTARVIVCRQLTVIASPPETGIYLTKGSKIWVGRWEEKSRELRQRNARQPRIVDLVNVK